MRRAADVILTLASEVQPQDTACRIMGGTYCAFGVSSGVRFEGRYALLSKISRLL